MRVRTDRLKSLRLPLLLAVALGVWLYANGMIRPAAWRVPASYSVDALEMLARLKLSGEKGAAFLFDKTMPDLGAPAVADWSAYAMPDAPVFITFGWLARWIGLVPASNLALVFAHLGAVAVFYVCGRALGHRALFAAAGALLFGFSFYTCYRGLSHYSFALTYVVPAQLLTAWLVGRGHRLLSRRRWRVFGYATAVATGVGNPYFGFAYGLLLAAALAYQAATARRRANLEFGTVGLALFAIVFMTMNASAIFALIGPHAGLLQRTFAATELYGLRPIELFIPSPYHHLAAAAALGTRYAALTSLPGELFSPYLGLAGIGGLLVMGWAAGRRLLRGEGGLRSAHAATFASFILFFMVGGINSALALGGFDLFRAGNRYSIYLLAIALFALVGWASRRLRRLPPAAVVGLTAATVLVGLWDQMPRARAAGEIALLRRKVADDHQLATVLRAALPRGSAVFQVPVVPFLEQPPVERMTDYELFRPWLFSHGLRFSYGLLTGNPTLRWQRWVAAEPVASMCAALEQAGFGALYLHKGAFTDDAASLRRQLEQLGKKLLVETDEQAVFLLQPSAAAQAPDLRDPRLADPWSRHPAPPGTPPVFAEQGWFGPEQDARETWRWAGQIATLDVWCPGETAANATLEFSCAALQPARLSAELAGREIWSAPTTASPSEPVRLVVPLRPGPNRFIFTYTGRLVTPSPADPRSLGFRLINLHAEISSRP